MTNGDVRYCLSSWKASSASSLQTRGPDFCRSLKNGSARSTSLDIKCLSHPVSFCTSLMQAGCYIALIVLIFCGLASIPRCETKKPSSLPAMTTDT
jgi:hypothetical protein